MCNGCGSSSPSRSFDNDRFCSCMALLLSSFFNSDGDLFIGKRSSCRSLARITYKKNLHDNAGFSIFLIMFALHEKNYHRDSNTGRDTYDIVFAPKIPRETDSR